MKLAIVHDYLNQFGGAERVVSAMHSVFPDAPVFTSIFDRKNMPEEFSRMDVRTTFMQRLPGIMRHFKTYLPLYPFAFESMDLRNFDLILSSSSAFAKGARKRDGALHICYCHNPMRFAWNYDDYVRDERLPALLKKALPVYIRRLKMWDVKTSVGVDHFIANSMTVARRILEHYGRDSTVINPPVCTSKFRISKEPGDYFLVVSRLKAYKRIELALEAAKRLDVPLRIVGSGEHEAALREAAGPKAEFLGSVRDSELSDLYSGCRALIFPGEEDFGIAPVEAMASGRPVIAYGRGGALETVIDGETGVFFGEQTAESLMESIQRIGRMEFDPEAIRRHALSFDESEFRKKINDFVQNHFVIE